MKKSRLFCVLAIMSIFLCSNKCFPDHEKILNLENQIVVNKDSISRINQEMNGISDSISFNKVSIDNEMAHARSINDSVVDFMWESPMATAYIRRFDSGMAQLIQPYLETKTDDELKGIIFLDFVLLLYYDNAENKNTVAMVKSGLESFDMRKQQCVSKAQYLQSLNNDLQRELIMKEERKQLYASNIDSLNTELEEEKN